MQVNKINKYTIFPMGSAVDLIIQDASNSSSMTISHYLDSTQFDTSSLPFTLIPVPKPIPYIKDPEFELAIRTKIDLSANDPNQQDMADKDKDTGKENYYNVSPSLSKPLPPGFIELKGQ